MTGLRVTSRGSDTPRFRRQISRVTSRGDGRSISKCEELSRTGSTKADLDYGQAAWEAEGCSSGTAATFLSLTLKKKPPRHPSLLGGTPGEEKQWLKTLPQDTAAPVWACKHATGPRKNQVLSGPRVETSSTFPPSGSPDELPFSRKAGG
ncbi:hypothetical protein CPLU01_06142 [Colletotrichum plurivorum]|uniref:Uncharacterized protein n=1 Tax=Colletotrichum plurivorum TaxID=2175906 RepID=A0A8H6NGE5_9PEZI|nr:hypothetical protein CPLU01_06142 [Colletotrichum plurivorum]